MMTKFRLYIGSVSSNPDRLHRREGVKWIVHSDFVEAPYPRNDIGIIKVNHPFGDRSNRAQIPKHFPYNADTIVVALGFGATRLSDTTEFAVYPDKLQKLTTKIKEHMVNVDSDTFFIGDYNHNVCYGDSGGPVIHNQTVIGIISSIGFHQRNPNCKANYARVVKVANYYDWIELSINNTSYSISNDPVLRYVFLLWSHYSFLLTV
ncbi:hypothetical protein Trydic_g15813 [Trypoxylus dichotomus]